MTYKGGCHCGNIAFEVEGKLEEIADCNCSICAKRGYLHWSVPRENLKLKTPASNIASYTFKSGQYKHQFCARCGCGPFISAPDAYYVNVRCLEGVDPARLNLSHFDGRSL